MKRRTFLVSAAALAGTGGLAVWSNARGITDYNVYAARLRRPLDPGGGAAELVRMATLAPNGHNTQGWRFHSSGRSITIAPDFSRRTPVVDPDDHHLFVSLGAAAENLVVAGPALTMPGEAIVGEDGSVRYDWTTSAQAAAPLTDAIRRRQSTRCEYDGRPLDTATLNALAAAGQGDGVRLVLITERPKINAVRDLVVTGNDAQMSDPAFITELKQWLRFSPQSAMEHGDGLYSAASGSPALPDFLGRPAFDLEFQKKSEAGKYAAQIDSSSGLAIFLADRADKRGWVTVGGAAQRFLLEATRHGVACAFVNQPVEVASLRPALAALVGEKGLRPDLVVRFGRTAPLPFSPRRDTSAVLKTA